MLSPSGSTSRLTTLVDHYHGWLLRCNSWIRGLGIGFWRRTVGNAWECHNLKSSKHQFEIRNRKKKRKQPSLSLHALFHPFLLTYDTTKWIVNGGLQDSLYKEIWHSVGTANGFQDFCWKTFKLDILWKKMPWSWFIVLPHQLIHSFRSKWSNNPRRYPTIFPSKFLDSTHEIFRIKTGWLWQQEYLANIYFLWLQAGRRTVRRWKRNPNRLVLRFSRNSTRPAGLRTCRGVLLSQWVEPCRYGEKTLGDDLRYSRLVCWQVFFLKFLAILKDGPPIFGGLRKWIGSLRTSKDVAAPENSCNVGESPDFFWHSRTPPYASLKNLKLVVMVVMNVMSESREKIAKQLGRDSTCFNGSRQVRRTHFRHLKSDEVMCFGDRLLPHELAAVNVASCCFFPVERLHRCAAAWQLCHLSTVWAPTKIRP